MSVILQADGPHFHSTGTAVRVQVTRSKPNHKAQVGLKDLVLKNAMNAYDVQARFIETKANIELGYVRQKVDALVAAMQSVGTQAAAALNAMHAGASYSGTERV